MPAPPSPSPSPSSTSTENGFQLASVASFWVSLLLLFVFLLYACFDYKWGRSRRRAADPPVAPPQQPPQQPAPLPSPSTVSLQRLFEYGKGGGKDAKNSDCIFCLEEFKEGELCRMLVNCKHVFHANCIDKWTVRKDHCPICGSSILVRVIYCSSDS